MGQWKGNYKHFTEKEMTCKCGCGRLPKHSFMVKLDQLREFVGFPLIITSGMRCPEYNNKVSNSGRTGPHTTGLACDISCHSTAYIIVFAAMQLGFKGIGVSQNPKGGRFIHIDRVPTRSKDGVLYSY